MSLEVLSMCAPQRHLQMEVSEIHHWSLSYVATRSDIAFSFSPFLTTVCKYLPGQKLGAYHELHLGACSHAVLNPTILASHTLECTYHDCKMLARCILHIDMCKTSLECILHTIHSEPPHGSWALNQDLHPCPPQSSHVCTNDTSSHELETCPATLL